ncbi:MAG TPA: hypothetical protein VGG29_03630 [Caulobacteraceae bacterium]|jgi:hypothetical protein
MLRHLKTLAVAAFILAGAAIAPPALAGTIGVGPTGLNLNAGLQGDVTNTDALGSSKRVFNSTFPLSLTGGTNAGQVDTFYAVQVTIAASSTSTIDLNGSAIDGFGNTVSFLHVKFILLAASAGNTNDCQIGPGATNPFAGPWSGTTPLTAVSPGETLLITKGQGSSAGWAVTAATGDIIKLANSSSGSSVTCTVYLAGTST